MKTKITDLKVEGDIFFPSENLIVHHELEYLKLLYSIFCCRKAHSR